jgi:hypothetical protein
MSDFDFEKKSSNVRREPKEQNNIQEEVSGELEEPQLRGEIQTENTQSEDEPNEEEKNDGEQRSTTREDDSNVERTPRTPQNLRWNAWYNQKGGKEKIKNQRMMKRIENQKKQQMKEEEKAQLKIKKKWVDRASKFKTKKDKWKVRFRNLKQQVKNPPENEEHKEMDLWGRPIYY